MKRILILSMLILTLGVNAMAQYSSREARKTLNTRAPREVRREARSLERDGYSTAPGAPIIERQLTDAWMRLSEFDDSGYPKYVDATGVSVGETQNAAKLQATEAAKLELAGSLQTNIAALIEQSIANQQMDAEEAASVTKTVAASQNIIAQELGRVITLTELYRKIGRNTEASVRIAYNSEMAMESAKKAIRKSLEEETSIVHEKLERLMNY